MNIIKSIRQGHQVMSFNQRRAERFVKTFMLQGREKIFHQLLQRMRIERTPFHLFSRIIIRLKSHSRKRQFGCRINIRMSNVNTSVKHGRLTEDNVFSIRLILAHHKLQSLKPYQINDSCSVREMTNQTSLASFPDCFKTKNFTAKLDIRHVPVYLMDVIKTATVNIFIREIIQQILKGTNIQFLRQDIRSLRAYSLQILDVARR